MDDLISRQAAIDRINKQREHLQPDIYPQDKIGDAAYRICAEFIERLPSAQPEQRWIPCSERLPSKADHTDDMVLVSYRNGSVRFNTYMNGWAQGNPVAWMPLPEPYRGERTEDLPSAQPERTCVNCGRTVNNGGWYADGRTRCPIEEHYALPKDGYCHLWEKRNVTDDDYPERREE